MVFRRRPRKTAGSSSPTLLLMSGVGIDYQAKTDKNDSGLLGQGLSASAIVRKADIDPKVVRKYIEPGLRQPPTSRESRIQVIDPFASYLRERVTIYPGLTGSRLLCKIRRCGSPGRYTAAAYVLRDIPPPADRVCKSASRRRPVSRRG